MRKKTRKLLKVTGIGAIILLAVIILALAFTYNSKSLSISENSYVYYPEYRAVCCEEKTSNSWVDTKVLSSSNAEVYYSCPSQTTLCRLQAQPTIDCKWYEYKVWSVKLYGTSGNTLNSWHNGVFGFFAEEYSGQPTFTPGQRVAYRGACVNYLNLITPPDVFSLLFSVSWARAPDTSNLNIQNIETVLKYYNTQGVPGGTIPNTQFCNKAGTTINEQKNEPKSGYDSKVEDAGEIADFVGENIGYDGDTDYTFLKNTPDQLFPGQCALSIGRWSVLPGFGNLKKYNGDWVICDLSMGLIKVEEIKTEGSGSYVVPTERLNKPNNFCCSNADCGYGYGCIDFSCQKGPGSCTTDLDCQPEGGYYLDDNCYQKEGKFYKWNSKCILGKCSGTDQEVKCCPSYCSAFGQVCDFNLGCQQVIPPTQPCPPGQCCNKNNLYGYYEQECSSSLECCNINGGVGTCKTECTNDDPDKCEGCWAWLKNKLGIKQDCDVGFWNNIWDDLSCPFYFLKLGILLVASIFALLFGQKFMLRTFDKLPLWSTWVIGIVFSGLIFLIGYLLLTWYFVIPLVIIMVGSSIIFNMIPGATAIKKVIKRR